MKFESSRQTFTEQTNERTDISIYWAPDRAKNGIFLVQNLLPRHVADFYLRAERGVEGEDLFAERRSDAGVLFASIPNFTEFYSEDVNEGVECIRLLNEIIIDFDEILDDEKFEAVEKIKTVGSTYMAASGITPVSDKVFNKTETLIAFHKKVTKTRA